MGSEMCIRDRTCENSHYYNDVKIKWNAGEIQGHCDALRSNGIQGQTKWNTGTIYVGEYRNRNTGEIGAVNGEVGSYFDEIMKKTKTT